MIFVRTQKVKLDQTFSIVFALPWAYDHPSSAESIQKGGKTTLCCRAMDYLRGHAMDTVR